MFRALVMSGVQKITKTEFLDMLHVSLHSFASISMNITFTVVLTRLHTV